MNVSSSSGSPKVLLVDDDDEVRAEMADYLTRNGFTVHAAQDAFGMEAALQAEDFPVMVLDVMLPGEDGLSICRRISQARGPAIIMLSAMTAEVDRIVGLEIGADDYLAKPCNPRELLARIRAVLRGRGAESEGDGGIRLHSGYDFEGYHLDTERRQLTSPTGVVSLLSVAELTLLVAFIENTGRILSREELLRLARSPSSEALDRAIDVAVSRLRRKLRTGLDRELIRTYRNAGYMLDAVVTPT